MGGSAFTPGVSFGMIWLRSTLASTRSRAMTRSSSGIDFSISATTSRICSLGSVGKLDSVIRKSLKLTSRSETDTFVSASIFTLPRAGLVAPFASYETAAYTTACRCSSQLATWGWYTTIFPPLDVV